MSLTAVLLFGSLARTDQVAGSDTDLLLVSEEQETNHISFGHLSLFIYPWEKLQRDARSGDLFACHLVLEARPVFDPDGLLIKLQEAFRLRTDYGPEISRAMDLGWFLVRFGHELNPALQAKRVLWCVRTILIARSAERGEPIFAPRLLAERATSKPARDLLTNRHQSRDPASLRSALEVFLTCEAIPTRFHLTADRNAFVARFVATFNDVAMHTLEQEERSHTGYV